MGRAAVKRLLLLTSACLLIGVIGISFIFGKGSGKHGRLMEVCWSSSGDKQGRVNEITLKAGENGELLLTVRASEAHYCPFSVSIYRADADALAQVRAILDRHGIAAWSKLPMDRDNIQLDGASVSLTMVFNDESKKGARRAFVRVSYEAKLPEGALDALGEVTDCLNQWAVPERLLDTRYEARQSGKTIGVLPEDEPVKAAFARLLMKHAFGSQLGSGVSFACQGTETIEGAACYVFSLENGESWAIGAESGAVFRRVSGESDWRSV